MSPLAHGVWVALVVVLGALAIVSLWSDVWEAYVSAFVIASALYVVTGWQALRR